MGRKELLLRSCRQIFKHFENPNGMDPDEFSFIGFLSWFTDHDTEFLQNILNESELKFEGDITIDIFYALWENLVCLGFGMGFALGSLGEWLNPNVKKNIEEIRDAIMQNGLLSHLNPAKSPMAMA
jgi:hypothetical protein